MSGGSKNYIYCQIDEYLCGQMHDAELNDLMEDIKDLAHELEWYESSDISEESYKASVKRFKQKWFGGGSTARSARLRGYVDREIAETQKRLYDLLGISENDDNMTGDDNLTDIAEMEPSARLYKILRRRGYDYIEQFRGKTAREIKRLHGIGPKSYEELRIRLAQRGITLEE